MNIERRIPFDLSKEESVSDTASTVSAGSCMLDEEGHCITCSDEMVTVRVLCVDQAMGMASVSVQDVTEEVDISLVDDVAPGNMLLVHGGVAIARVDEVSDV